MPVDGVGGVGGVAGVLDGEGEMFWYPLIVSHSTIRARRLSRHNLTEGLLPCKVLTFPGYLFPSKWQPILCRSKAYFTPVHDMFVLGSAL